ncbi:MAG: hypothetical protein GY950_16100 [bacterium]|nr:hypothetical protein [bacterium]
MKKFLSLLMYTTAVILLLINTACPEGCKIVKWSPAGNWSVTRVLGEETVTMTLEFNGSDENGDIVSEPYLVGYYEYTDKSLTLVIQFPIGSDTPFGTSYQSYSGVMDDEDHLSGTLLEYSTNPAQQGTWTAVRVR